MAQGTVQARRGHGCLALGIIGLILMLAAGLAVPFLVLPSILGPAAASLTKTGLNPFDVMNSDEILRTQMGITTQAMTRVDPTRFDAITIYPQVTEFAGANLQLTRMRAFGVRRDGTMDLTASYTPAPRVEYEFIRSLPGPPPDAPPIGAGGVAGTFWQEKVTIEIYEPGQLRRSSSSTGGARFNIQWQNKGMVRRVDKPIAVQKAEATNLAAPDCPLATLWQLALARGAPPEAVATIDYGRDGYEFSIQGTSVRFRVGPNCQITSRG